MHHFMRVLTLALFLIVALSSAASAAVKLRAGVRPETLAQCAPGKAFVAIGNTGERAIRIRISLALVNASDAVVLGPYYGKLHLAAGERRMREFRFLIPKDFAPGDYAWVVRALSVDVTRDLARAPFVVIEGDCEGPELSPEGLDPAGAVLEDLGFEPDNEAPQLHHPSWGEIKRRYQN